MSLRENDMIILILGISKRLAHQLGTIFRSILISFTSVFDPIAKGDTEWHAEKQLEIE